MHSFGSPQTTPCEDIPTPTQQPPFCCSSNTWIFYAISHKVEELELVPFFISQPFELPRSLFSCESLEVLTLNGKILLNCPPSVHLPNLEGLFLTEIKYANDETVRRLLAGCPELVRLGISRKEVDNLMTFNNCHPTLEGFTMDNRGEDPRFKLEINAPSLQCLVLFDRICQDYLVYNSTNLVKVVIDLFDENYGYRVYKLLRAISNVQTLALSLQLVPSYILTYRVIVLVLSVEIYKLNREGNIKDKRRG
jgi:hypothetical protein